MSLGIVAILEVKEEKTDAFEAGFKKMQDAVRVNEAGCLLYTLCRKQDAPTTYVVMERYADKDALAAHGKSDAFKQAAGSIGDCLAGKPDISILDLVSE